MLSFVLAYAPSMSLVVWLNLNAKPTLRLFGCMVVCAGKDSHLRGSTERSLQTRHYRRGTTDAALRTRQLACALCTRPNPGGTLASNPRAGDAAARTRVGDRPPALVAVAPQSRRGLNLFPKSKPTRTCGDARNRRATDG